METRPTSYSVESIPRGEPGILRTVDAVRALVKRTRALPVVRTAAVTITKQCGRADDRCSALAILDWVRAHLRYVKDPTDTELLQTPDRLVTQIVREGQAAGDCDDGAALVGALDQALGLSARIVVGSFRPDRALHHVWVEVLAKGRVIPQDPFRSERFDAVPTRLVYREI